MNGFILLAVAIIAEVFASSMLKQSNGFRKKLPVVGMALGYLISFWGLSLALETIPLGVSYAIWSGVGTAFTALIGVLVYKEWITVKKVIGTVLIIFGVVLLNIGG